MELVPPQIANGVPTRTAYIQFPTVGGELQRANDTVSSRNLFASLPLTALRVA
jgi:hypothetical protein